jgi:hypothetical protein
MKLQPFFIMPLAFGQSPELVWDNGHGVVTV